MFTGIVEELGRVLDRRGARLVVAAGKALDGTDLGSSVAVNGVCLTVVERGSDALGFDMGPETLTITTLGDLVAGDPVNLERPLRMGDFLGGHIVQGHVDGIGVVTAVERAADTSRIRVEWQDPRLAPYLIAKGSVAVDGVSLTVAALEEGAFEVMVIPHTLAVTTLGATRRGRRVNLEMDMIGKYVLRAWSLGGRPAGEPGGTRS
ncbi:MAG TPA: riboflavin synthase [Methylomirabilota bacterium]|nr:riboflavin synthase [Methylomirabilota bacterium]